MTKLRVAILIAAALLPALARTSTRPSRELVLQFPAVGASSIGFLVHRERIFPLNRLLDPAVRASTSDEFVRDFRSGELWALGGDESLEACALE